MLICLLLFVWFIHPCLKPALHDDAAWLVLAHTLHQVAAEGVTGVGFVEPEQGVGVDLLFVPIDLQCLQLQ